MEEDIRSFPGLNYIEFQVLSPTRCDVFISIEGVREKVGSGYVRLFASCFPKVEMEVGKGKQRIRLESLHGSKDSWFTKATLERFLEFVNTPDVFECFEGLEDEVSGLEQNQRSHLEGENGASASSIKDLVREMDTRLCALQQEQDMVLSRSTAASFSEMSAADLLIFSDHSNINWLKDGCMRFLTLCKKKKKTMMISMVWPDNHCTEKSADDDAPLFSWPGKTKEESKQPQNFESSQVGRTHAFNSLKKQEGSSKQSLGKSQSAVYQGHKHCQIHEYEQIHSSPAESPSSSVTPNVISSESDDPICSQSENGKELDSSEDRQTKACVMKMAGIEDHTEEETPLRRLTVQAAISMFESKKTTFSGSWGGRKAVTDNSAQKLRRQETRPCVPKKDSDNLGEAARNLELGLIKNQSEARECPSSNMMLLKQTRHGVDDLVQKNFKISLDSNITHPDKIEHRKKTSAPKPGRQESCKALAQSCSTPPCVRSNDSQGKARTLEVGLMKRQNHLRGCPTSHVISSKPASNNLVRESAKMSMDNLTCQANLNRFKENTIRKLSGQGSCKMLTQSCSSLPQRQICKSDKFKEKGRNIGISLTGNKNVLEGFPSHSMLTKQVYAKANDKLVQENFRKPTDNPGCDDKLEQLEGNRQSVEHADIVSKRRWCESQNSSEKTLSPRSENCVWLDDIRSLSNGSVVPFEIKVQLSFQSTKNHVSPVEGQSILARPNSQMAEIQDKNISGIPSSFKLSMPNHADGNDKPVSMPTNTSSGQSQVAKLTEESGNSRVELPVISEMLIIQSPHRSNVSVQYSNSSEPSMTTQLTGACENWHSLVVSTNPQTKSADWEQTTSSNAFSLMELHMIALMKMAEQSNSNEKTHGQRGKFYEQYSRIRDARLKSESPLNKGQREARLKSMQETFLRQSSELKREALKFSRKQSRGN